MGDKLRFTQNEKPWAGLLPLPTAEMMLYTYAFLRRSA
jgi:hypothetical protein